MTKYDDLLRVKWFVNDCLPFIVCYKFFVAGDGVSTFIAYNKRGIDIVKLYKSDAIFFNSLAEYLQLPKQSEMI